MQEGEQLSQCTAEDELERWGPAASRRGVQHHGNQTRPNHDISVRIAHVTRAWLRSVRHGSLGLRPQHYYHDVGTTISGTHRRGNAMLACARRTATWVPTWGSWAQGLPSPRPPQWQVTTSSCSFGRPWVVWCGVWGVGVVCVTFSC